MILSLCDEIIIYTSLVAGIIFLLKALNAITLAALEKGK